MRRISRSASSNMARVVSPSGMPKPLNSVDDEPRPVPNSKRPSLRWSSMATRSATRAGWLTGGVRFQIAEPRWMRVVRAAMKGSTISEAERCEYSSRKWCSTDHTYLKPWRSAASASSTSRSRRACSAPPGSASTSWRGTCAWTKRPNSIAAWLAEPSRGCQTNRAGGRARRLIEGDLECHKDGGDVVRVGLHESVRAVDRARARRSATEAIPGRPHRRLRASIPRGAAVDGRRRLPGRRERLGPSFARRGDRRAAEIPRDYSRLFDRERELDRLLAGPEKG